MYDIVIIGGGPAGLTAAIYSAGAKYKTLVIEKNEYGGQITITDKVTNYPGILETSGRKLGYDMHLQGESFGAEYAIEEVTEIEDCGNKKIVHTNKRDIETIGVIVAAGARPAEIGFPGEKAFKGRGISYCATCDGALFSGKDVFVIGGGEAACQESIFLTRYARKVLMIIRKSEFSVSKNLEDEVRLNPKIEIHFNTEVEEVGGDETLKYARFKNNVTGDMFNYDAEGEGTFGIFVFAGYEPDTKFIADILKLDDKGHIITKADKSTNINGICAAGDICVKDLRQIVTAVSDGAIAASTLEKYIAEVKRQTVGSEEAIMKGSIKQDDGNQSENVSPVNDEKLFDEETSRAIQNMFDKEKSKIHLKAYLDHREVSKEIVSFLKALEKEIENVTVEFNDEGKSPTGLYPFIGIYKENGKYLGTGFHGLPADHEFESFVIAIKNAMNHDENVKLNDEEIPIHIKVIVTLACNQCPETVIAAQKIAINNENVQTEIFDIDHFPKMQEQYGILSVPCIVVEGPQQKDAAKNEKILFGRKSEDEIMKVINEII